MNSEVVLLLIDSTQRDSKLSKSIIFISQRISDNNGHADEGKSKVETRGKTRVGMWEQ